MLTFSGSKLLRFEQYTSTRLLAQFDEDLQNVQKISLRINTGNIIGPRYKIRLLRIRFTPLERPDRSELRSVTSWSKRGFFMHFNIKKTAADGLCDKRCFSCNSFYINLMFYCYGCSITLNITAEHFCSDHLKSIIFIRLLFIKIAKKGREEQMLN